MESWLFSAGNLTQNGHFRNMSTVKKHKKKKKVQENHFKNIYVLKETITVDLRYIGCYVYQLQ